MDREMGKNNNISEKNLKIFCSTGYFSALLIYFCNFTSGPTQEKDEFTVKIFLETYDITRSVDTNSQRNVFITFVNEKLTHKDIAQRLQEILLEKSVSQSRLAFKLVDLFRWCKHDYLLK